MCLVQLAAELLTWTKTLAFAGSIAPFWEPNDYGCTSSTSLPASSQPHDGTGYGYLAAGPGPT